MMEIEQCHADLLDLAYPYAMDAVAEIERRSIEKRLAEADPRTVAAFSSIVRGVRETLAALTVVDAVNPPPTLEAKVLRSLNELPGRVRPDRRGVRSALRRVPRLARLVFAAAAVIAAAGAGGVVIAERITSSARRADHRRTGTRVHTFVIPRHRTARAPAPDKHLGVARGRRGGVRRGTRVAPRVGTATPTGLRRRGTAQRSSHSTTSVGASPARSGR
ncbi:hypothetical protein OH799_08995 [Nocardia sp. NBC_00881]|uniref:RskA family anti-sigma factor n=1 Tax=Nocardia sp. NBC_00881 TaxID=2975995 RepID=UPI00386B3B7B|nr:hypothetical protein OH799_08995 [Nocardia sp. NBC_00881]